MRSNQELGGIRIDDSPTLHDGNPDGLRMDLEAQASAMLVLLARLGAF